MDRRPRRDNAGSPASPLTPTAEIGSVASPTARAPLRRGQPRTQAARDATAKQAAVAAAAAAEAEAERLAAGGDDTTPLSDVAYANSLSCFGHTTQGRVAFTTCQLQQLQLTRLDPIAAHGTHLKRLYLDGNNLTTLVALSACVGLTHLSVSENQLTEKGIFPFLKRSGSTLEFLDVSRNQLTSLRGLEHLAFLMSLNLDSNQLTSLEVSADLLATPLNAAEPLSAAGGSGGNGAEEEVFYDEQEDRSEDDVVDEFDFQEDPDHEDDMTGETVRQGIDVRYSYLGSRPVKKNLLAAEGGARVQKYAKNPLRALRSLLRLSCANNKIARISPYSVSKCPLRMLNVANNGLESLAAIATAPLGETLMVLRAEDNEIMHLTSELAPLALLRQLVSVNLAGNNLRSVTDVLPLAELPQLRHLTLADCPMLQEFQAPANAHAAQGGHTTNGNGLVSVRARPSAGALASAGDASDTNAAGDLDAVDEDHPSRKRRDVVRSDAGPADRDKRAALQTFMRVTSSAAGTAGTRDTPSDRDPGELPRHLTQHILHGTVQTVHGAVTTPGERDHYSPLMPVPSASALLGTSGIGTGTRYASGATGHGATLGGAGGNRLPGPLNASIQPSGVETLLLRDPGEQDSDELARKQAADRYRLAVLYRVPQVETLDGVAVTADEAAEAARLEGGYTRERRAQAVRTFVPAAGNAARALRQSHLAGSFTGTTNGDADGKSTRPRENRASIISVTRSESVNQNPYAVYSS